MVQPKQVLVCHQNLFTCERCPQRTVTLPTADSEQKCMGDLAFSLAQWAGSD